MTTRKRICTVVTFAAVALALFAGSAQALEGQLGILTPGTLSGNNPATGAPWAVGDQYRFAFFTSEKRTATETDISVYNNWVQGLANLSTVYDIGADDGVTWNVIGSTDEVDAIDNTSTTWTDESPGSPIFLLDGSTLIARDYKDLWDHEIQHIIDVTEQGDVDTWWPWTGTYWDGTAAPGHPTSYGALGSSGQVGQGNSSSATDWIWRTNTADPPTNLMNMYALSDPLVIVGQTDANIPDVDAGADVITWSGRAVQLDPNVIEKAGSDWTDLTYLWSAEPDTGVDFSNAIALAPTVTITKATENPSSVTLTLAVNNEGRLDPPVTDSMTIDVYDDACLAAEALGPVELDPTDFNHNCLTNFEDFALLAATWLDDYTLTGAVPK